VRRDVISLPSALRQRLAGLGVIYMHVENVRQTPAELPGKILTVLDAHETGLPRRHDEHHIGRAVGAKWLRAAAAPQCRQTVA
jgi:hypothetical protein